MILLRHYYRSNCMKNTCVKVNTSTWKFHWEVGTPTMFSRSENSARLYVPSNILFNFELIDVLFFFFERNRYPIQHISYIRIQQYYCIIKFSFRFSWVTYISDKKKGDDARIGSKSLVTNKAHTVTLSVTNCL